MKRKDTADKSKDTRAPKESQRSFIFNFLAVLSTIFLISYGFLVYKFVELHESFFDSTDDRIALEKNNESFKQEIRSRARENADLITEVHRRVSKIDADLAEMRSQRLTLDSLYRNITESKLAWTLGEIENALVIAQQHLSLSGNVGLALETLLKVRNLVVKSELSEIRQLGPEIDIHIERLESYRGQDKVKISNILRQQASIIKDFPFLGTIVATDNVNIDNQVNEKGAFKWGLSYLWSEFKQLIRVDTIDGSQIPVLSEEQRFIVRESVRVRLLSARLALTVGDYETFKDELSRSRKIIIRFFDSEVPAVASALDTLSQLNIEMDQNSGPSIQPLIETLRLKFN